MRGDVDTEGSRPFLRVATSWWRRGGQFDWLTDYLHARGLAGYTRTLMAVLSGALVLIAVGAAITPYQPRLLSAVMGLAIAAFAIRYCLLWLRRWPTKNQSLMMGIGGGVLTAVSATLQPDAHIGLLSCTGLALVGGYLALFHGTRAVVFTMSLALVAAAICAVRVAAAGANPAATAAGFFLVAELNVAVPLAIQTIAATLGADVLRSDHDPLTGVLNRRAFYERATAMLRVPAPDLHLLVVMIDLDKFKVLNDTYGHTAGDEALTAVGWALRQCTGDVTVIGRSGGEEFVVLDWLPRAEAERLPDTLRTAIAALPHPVTASVGAVIAHWDGLHDPLHMIETLIHSADEAMYRAKRMGGNQTLICPVPPNG